MTDAISRIGRRAVGSTMLVGVFALLCAAPTLFLTQGYELDVAREAFFIASLAASWSLLAGVAGQFSFAHYAIAGLAGYAGAIWTIRVDGPWGGLYTGIAFGAIVACAVGTVLGLLLLRLRAVYLALFTLAFAEIVRLIILGETELTGGANTLSVTQLPVGPQGSYYLLLGLLASTLVCIYGLLRTRIGLFLRSLREDEGAAAAVGVHTVRMKIFVFCLTSLMVGTVASLYFHTVPRLSPNQIDFGAMAILAAFAVLGGIESPLAAALASLIGAFMLEVMRGTTIDGATLYTVAAVVAVISVMLLIRSAGCARRLGARARWHRVAAGTLWIAGATIGVAATIVAGQRDQGDDVSLLIAIGVGLVPVLLAAGLLRRGGLSARQSILLVASAVGLVSSVALVIAESVSIELGVWRFALFGLALLLTVRFARNGLIAPLLAYFVPQAGLDSEIGSAVAAEPVHEERADGVRAAVARTNPNADSVAEDDA